MRVLWRKRHPAATPHPCPVCRTTYMTNRKTCSPRCSRVLADARRGIAVIRASALRAVRAANGEYLPVDRSTRVGEHVIANAYFGEHAGGSWVACRCGAVAVGPDPETAARKYGEHTGIPYTFRPIRDRWAAEDYPVKGGLSA
jgi:hypothetical protein